MRSGILCITAILCLAQEAFSQQAFEVATIRPVGSARTNVEAGVRIFPGGRIEIHGLSLKALIAAAYDAGFWQLSGGNDWIANDLFDVEAKPASQSGPYSLRYTRFGIDDEGLRGMLQNLLTERFQLKLRRETKAGAIYLLERSGRAFLPHGTKFSDDRPLMDRPGFGGDVEHVGGHWFLFNVSSAELAKFASDYVVHKPVRDATGLSGSFDYREADANVPQDNSDFEGSFLAFVHGIGLKLTPSRGPVETFIIEHAEKPTPN